MSNKIMTRSIKKEIMNRFKNKTVIILDEILYPKDITKEEKTIISFPTNKNTKE